MRSTRLLRIFEAYRTKISNVPRSSTYSKSVPIQELQQCPAFSIRSSTCSEVSSSEPSGCRTVYSTNSSPGSRIFMKSLWIRCLLRAIPVMQPQPELLKQLIVDLLEQPPRWRRSRSPIPLAPGSYLRVGTSSKMFQETNSSWFALVQTKSYFKSHLSSRLFHVEQCFQVDKNAGKTKKSEGSAKWISFLKDPLMLGPLWSKGGLSGSSKVESSSDFGKQQRSDETGQTWSDYKHSMGTSMSIVLNPNWWDYSFCINCMDMMICLWMLVPHILFCEFEVSIPKV